MKTGIVTALLLLGVLSPMTTALADPIVSLDHDVYLLHCLGVGSDGQVDRVGNAWVNIDVRDQSHPFGYCLA